MMIFKGCDDNNFQFGDFPDSLFPSKVIIMISMIMMILIIIIIDTILILIMIIIKMKE